MDTRIIKAIAVKGIKLQKCFDDYVSEDATQKKKIFEKFEYVRGASMADHILCSSKDAEDLIWRFDYENLQLFVEKF